MAISRTLGSPIAKSLALAANPELLIAGAVIGGVAVTVAAGVLIYKKIDAFNKKRNQAKIERLNNIWAKTLQDIHVVNLGKKVNLPPFFQKDKDNPEILHTIYVSDDDLKKYGQARAPGDVTLLKYFRNVKSAIQKIRYYYFLRIKENASNRHDPISKVLLYLLYTLEQFCTKFEGYNLDIAYMKAIAACLNELALWEKTTTSQIHSHLQEALEHIEEGVRVLEWHNHELSMHESVDNLNDSCVTHCEDLIQLLLKSIINKKHRDDDLIMSATFEELAMGLVRKEHIKLAKFDFVFWNESQIDLPDSIFSDWIKVLANYYLKVEDARYLLSQNDIPDFEKLFTLPTLSVEGKSKEQIKHDELIYQNIRTLFKNSKSVMVSKAVPIEGKTGKFTSVVVTDNKEIFERMKIFSDVFSLFTLISSISYNSIHILKGIKNLGVLYMQSRTTAPYSNIFYVLDQLRNLLISSVEKNRANLEKIRDYNKGAKTEDQSLLAEYEIFLKAIDKEILPIFDDVKRLREDAISNPRLMQMKIHKEEHEMQTVAMTLAKAFKLDLPLTREEHSQSELKKDTSTLSPSPYVKTEVKPVTTANIIKKDVIHEIVPELINDVNKTYSTLLSNLKKCQKNLIDLSVDQYVASSEWNAYKELQRDLDAIQMKANSLEIEKSKSVERHEKANDMLVVFFDWISEINSILSEKKENRIDLLRDFIKNKNDELQRVNGSLASLSIDQHSSQWKEYTNKTFNMRLFTTKSHTLLDRLCGSLTKLADSYQSEMVIANTRTL